MISSSGLLSLIEMKQEMHGHQVRGVGVDAETRCGHYNSDLDIIAIKFKCCAEWYSCFECHTASADHVAVVWSANERDQQAVLCGGCGNEMTIDEYMASESRCLQCSRGFNPGCVNHYHLYFA